MPTPAVADEKAAEEVAPTTSSLQEAKRTVERPKRNRNMTVQEFLEEDDMTGGGGEIPFLSGLRERTGNNNTSRAVGIAVEQANAATGTVSSGSSSGNGRSSSAVDEGSSSSLLSSSLRLSSMGSTTSAATTAVASSQSSASSYLSSRSPSDHSTGPAQQLLREQQQQQQDAPPTQQEKEKTEGGSSCCCAYERMSIPFTYRFLGLRLRLAFTKRRFERVQATYEQHVSAVQRHYQQRQRLRRVQQQQEQQLQSNGGGVDAEEEGIGRRRRRVVGPPTASENRQQQQRQQRVGARNAFAVVENAVELDAALDTSFGRLRKEISRIEHSQNEMRRRALPKVQELLSSHRTLLQFLAGFDDSVERRDSSSSRCRLSVLNRDVETTTSLKKLIAEYAGVPVGRLFHDLKSLERLLLYEEEGGGGGKGGNGKQTRHPVAGDNNNVDEQQRQAGISHHDVSDDDSRN